VVGEAKDGLEAIDLSFKLKPDVVIMDIQMPKLGGVEATKRIKKEFPDIIVLVLTIHEDSEYVLNILDAGASGYLTKNVIGKEIPNAIRAVVNGESILSEEIMKRLLKYALRYPTKTADLNHGEKLSIREVEILSFVARGASNITIAKELNLSINTVKKYMMGIFDKLETTSRTAAVINAHRLGLISIDSQE
jgi:two-component system response regulator DegU